MPDRGAIAVAQLPARDLQAAARPSLDPPLGPEAAPASEVEAGDAALGDGSDSRPFSTATYRGKRKRR